MTQWVVFISVGECQSEEHFICLSTKTTQRACARGVTQDRKRTRESKVPEQDRTEEGSQQERAVNRSQGKLTVRKRRLIGSVDPEAGLVNARGWMSQRSWWLCGNFAWIHTRDSPQKHRMLGKCQTSPFLCLELTQVCSFFSSTLSVVYVVSVKKCEIPLAGGERNH